MLQNWFGRDRRRSRAGSEGRDVAEAEIEFAVFLFEAGEARLGGREVLFEADELPLILGRKRPERTLALFRIGVPGGGKC